MEDSDDPPWGELQGEPGACIVTLCNNHLDNQPGLLQCEEIKKKIEIDIKMEDVIGENVDLKNAKKITEILQLREKMVKEK